MKDPTQPGLWIVGPPSVFSEEARALLGKRLEIVAPDQFCIKPLAEEKLLVLNTGHNLQSPIIAHVGPFTLQVSVEPFRHDIIEVVYTSSLAAGTPPPEDPDLTLLGYHGPALNNPKHQPEEPPIVNPSRRRSA